MTKLDWVFIFFILLVTTVSSIALVITRESIQKQNQVVQKQSDSIKFLKRELLIKNSMIKTLENMCEEVNKAHMEDQVILKKCLEELVGE